MTAVEQVSTGQPGRLPWLDQMRGVALIVMVGVFTAGGLHHAGLLLPGTGVGETLRRVFTFVMPVFFLLSGWTFERQVRGARLLPGMATRAGRLIWATLLWTYILIGLRLLTGDNTNSQATLDSLLVFPPLPEGHLRYLAGLMLIQLLLAPVVVAAGRAGSAALWLALSALAMLVLGFKLLPHHPVSSPAVLLAPVFLLGMAMARMAPLPRGPALIVAAGLACATPVLFLWYHDTHHPNGAFAQGLGLVPAVALALAFHQNPDGLRGPAGRALTYLGAMALPVFVTTTVFTGATRVALQSVTQNLPLHLVSGVVAGLLGPILLCLALRHLGVQRGAVF